MNSGSRKKIPMPATSVSAEHERDRALAELDALLLGLDVGAADEPARADDERLVQDDRPRTSGHFDQRVPWKPASRRSVAQTIRPSGWRRATAIASRPRIRTPSMRAWPP